VVAKLEILTLPMPKKLVREDCDSREHANF